MINQKGNTLIIVILLGLLVAGGLFGAYFLCKKSSKTTTSTPFVNEAANSATSGGEQWNAAQKKQATLPDKPDHLYFAIGISNQDGKPLNIYAILPEGSTIKYDNPDSMLLNSHLVVNGVNYSLVTENAGRDGPCPVDESDPSCGATDEPIQATSPLTTAIIRVWKNKTGIFWINPQEISVNGAQINNIQVSKEKGSFSESEVDLWRQIFQSMTFEDITS